MPRALKAVQCEKPEHWLDLREDQLEEIRKYWMLAAERPDYFSYNHGSGFVSMLHQLKPTRSGKLLEIGCGNAAFARSMEKLGWRVYGADVVRGISRLDNFCVCPAWDMPYQDDLFDLVASFDCFEHIIQDDVPSAIAESFRVLAPGGVLALKIAYAQSISKGIKGELLHPTVQDESWWVDITQAVTSRKVLSDFPGLIAVRK